MSLPVRSVTTPWSCAIIEIGEHSRGARSIIAQMRFFVKSTSRAIFILIRVHGTKAMNDKRRSFFGWGYEGNTISAEELSWFERAWSKLFQGR